MRAIVELVTVCAGALAISNYAVAFFMRKRQRRRDTNLEHTRRLLEENREMDELLDHITRRKER